jgi:hypothetical protein
LREQRLVGVVGRERARVRGLRGRDAVARGRELLLRRDDGVRRLRSGHRSLQRRGAELRALLLHDRLLLRERGAQRRVVELRHDLTAPDVLPFVDVDRGDVARLRRAERRFLNRRDLPVERDVGRDVLTLRLRDVHRERRRRGSPSASAPAFTARGEGQGDDRPGQQRALTPSHGAPSYFR